MNAVGTGTEVGAELEANRRIEAENARRDAAGMTFLVGMLVTGALVVVAALSFAGPPAGADTTADPSGTQLSAH